MTHESTFSVIIPCFNSARTLEQTVASVMAQSDPDWELIIVDDGSTDATYDTALKLLSTCEQIRVIATKNRGVSAARNAGAAAARGAILAFLDADDAWDPETLAAHRARFAAEPDLMVAYARVAFADAMLRPLGRISAKPPAHLQAVEVLGENPACTGSNILVRRNTFERIGGFDEHLGHAEDQEWLFRALLTSGGRLGGLDRVLVLYRANPSGAHGDLKAMEKGWETMLARAAHAAPVEVAVLRDHAKARHLRLLARRALRDPQQACLALPLMARALRRSPALILSWRSLQTLAAAIAMAIVPTQSARGRLARLFG